MDNDALKKDVELIVTSIFSAKEDAEKERLTKEALRDSAEVVTGLTTSITEKDEVITDLESKVSDAEVTIAEHVGSIDAEKAKVEDLTKQLEEVTTKLSASELEVVDMRKDMAADARMSELKESKVIGTDEKAQRGKVKEMSDEEFASYQTELIELRKSIETELAATAPVVKPDDVTGDTPVTPDMDINIDSSEQAALNLEGSSPEDLVSNYTDLGKAMAAAWVEDKS